MKKYTTYVMTYMAVVAAFLGLTWWVDNALHISLAFLLLRQYDDHKSVHLPQYE